MSKLASKLSRQILAVLLSIAMIMPNMTAYASEVSVPETQKEITVDNSELNEEQPSLTSEEPESDEGGEETLPEEAGEAAAVPSYTEDEVSGSNADEKGAANDLRNSGVVAFGLEDDTLTGDFGAAAKALNTDNFPGFDEFVGFQNDTSNQHGAQTKSEGATIKFTAPGTASDTIDIDVVLCMYGPAMNAKMSATVAGADNVTILKTKVSDDGNAAHVDTYPAPKYTVFGVKGGSEVTLTFADSGTYVHSVVAAKRTETLYAIEVAPMHKADDVHGTAIASPAYAKANEAITLTAEPDEGYELGDWIVESPTAEADKPAITEDANDSNKVTFTMPAANVKITASFTEVVDAKYNVHVFNGYHGTATLKTGQGTNITIGDEVTLADVVEVTPEAGYDLKGWYVTQASNNSTKVEIPVTEGKFTMPAGDVDVMPVYAGALKDGYTYSFRGNKSERAQNAQLKDYGMITFEGFKDADNDHGFITDGQNGDKAVMKLNLSDKATVVVETCCYGTSNVTAKIGETAYTPAKDTNTGEPRPNSTPVVYGEIYTITTDKGGELELTFDDNNAYIHSVTATYIQEGGNKKYVSTNGLELDFMTLVRGHAANEAVASQANGLGDGVTITNFKWFDPGNNHGIVTNGNTGTIVLNLADGKRANIKVTGCQFSNNEMSTSSGEQSKDESADPVYTILGAEGTVTLTFPHQIYLHKISVAYMADDEYLVKVVDTENGKASADVGYKKAGQTVTLTAEPDGGYGLEDWQVIKPVGLQITKDQTDANKATFTMPGEDVEVKAIFNMTGTSKTITVATNAEHGSVAAIGEEAITRISGVTVNTEEIATVTPDDGYELTGWTITNTDSGAEITNANVTKEAFGNYSFTMPDANVTITPVFETAKTVKADIYAFGNKTPGDLSKTLDGFTFDKTFVDATNGHGILTNAANTKIKLYLADSADIEIVTCCYNAGTGAKINPSSGNYSYVVYEEEPKKNGLRHTVKKADKGLFTLTFETTNVYIHSISVEYVSDVPDVFTDGIDVWDFGAEQLESTDEVKYNNKLTVDIINSWYPQSVRDAVAAGGEKKNYTINSFEVTNEDGIVDFCFRDGGGSHRLRSDNDKLIRYDDKTLELDDTTYHGYIYDNKGKNKDIYVGVRLNAGDIMTAVVSSNTGDYTITVEDPKGGTQNFARPKGASLIKYYATESGMHKIYNGIDEKLVVGRVTRQHSKSVKVSGTVSIPEGVSDELTLEFTCKESGMVKEAVVAEDGSYEVELFENYNYDVVVIPKTYVIDEGAELELGEANATQTAEHNIKVSTVLLRTLSGSIVGLDDDAAAINVVDIKFKKPTDKLYTPVITIDRTAKTYTAELESGVEYTMITEGINDYELDNNANNNSDRIKINSATMGRNITYKKKPVYNVTIQPQGATLTDLASAKFIFTNINEEGYVYTFTGTNNIKLRDGTYSVVVADSGIYIQTLTSNFVVDGADVTKTIAFRSDISKWIFSEAEGFTAASCTAGNYNGLKLTGVRAESGKAHAVLGNESKIEIPVKGNCDIEATYYYAAAGKLGNVDFEAHQGESLGSTSKTETVSYSYTGGAGYVELTTTATTYITKIEIKTTIPYKANITVNPSQAESDTNYTTINDALEAVRKMDRTSTQAVTISITPGNYEEMLVIDVNNIKLVNASSTPSIGLRNKGIDIDPNAVRITAYYGHGYSYYSMGNDCKWNAEVLATNKANGHESYTNPGSGSTDGSYWNATVVIDASNVSAEGIIFENSFNQYISKKAADDVIVKQSSAKEGTVTRASMAYGDTTVQQKEYVERAAALAITNQKSNITFDNCKFIGRQDTLYGGTNTKAAFYKCSIYGGTDYIMGAMIAVFAKCDLVFNTSEDKNDVGYITAPQQAGGRGYLMWNCHVTSTVPGIDTASRYTSKPGYLGRPWTANTGEAIFYKTIVDEVDTYWQGNPTDLKDELKGKSLIAPAGWNDSLNGTTRSDRCQERSTYEVSGVDNTTQRKAVTWASFLETDNLISGEPISVATFFGEWNPFTGKDMEIVLPSDANIAAPAAPTAIVTPEPTDGENNDKQVIKGASIVLSAETGAKIYYNVNGTAAPTADESNLYTGAIEVKEDNIADDSITIKAIAVKYGKTSAVAEFTYSVIDTPVTAKPVFTPDSGNIELGSRITMSAEAGAEIRYDINSATDPDVDSTLYSGKDGIKITNDKINAADSTVTIKAIAIRYGKPSEVTEVTYNVEVNAPVADPKSGYQFPDGGGKVKLTADEGVDILYTIGDNPEDPTAEGITPETYDKEGNGIQVSADTTIKAVAKRGSKYSDVVTLNYKVPLSMPTADPESGTLLPYPGGNVKLNANEATSTIYYTIATGDEVPADPTDANSGRETYDRSTTNEGIRITEKTTIKAVAESGGKYSTVAVFTYAVEDPTPKATPGDGHKFSYGGGKVKLSSEVASAKIYYTIGADPADPRDENSGRREYDRTDDNAGIEVTGATTIKAVAKVGDDYSDVVTFNYTILIPVPTADPESGTNFQSGGGKVKLNSELVAAKIYYTIGANPADPREENRGRIEYDRSADNDGISITKSTTIKAVTEIDGLYSDVETFNYTVEEDHSDDSGLIIKFVDEGEGTYEYTGSAIKPDIEVRNNGKLLVPGTDYTVKYANNINVPTTAKKPTVTVTGKGILSGKVVKEFTITPKSLEDVNEAGDNDVIAGRIVVAKNKKVPAPSVYYGNTKLKAGKDFEYDKNKTYSAEKDDETLPITGKGNFGGTLDVPVKVVADAKAVKEAAKKFTVGIDKTKSKALMYTGESLAEAIEDCITVNAKDSAKTDLKTNAAQNYILVLPKDKDIINAGTVKFTVVGIGEYSGCNVTKSCKILPKTIAKEDVVIDKGSATAQDGKVLVSGIEDKATFESTGATFPEMKLTYGSDAAEMKPGVDYKVSYSGNKKVTDANKSKFTITFMGNYKGKYVSDAFGINKAELDEDTAKVVIPDMVCNGKDGIYKAKPYVTINNVTLKASEYTPTYYLDEAMTTEMDKTNKLSLGDGISKTVYVKIEPSAKSNYQNTDKDKTLTGSYTVWKKGSKETDLSKAKVTFYEGTTTKATGKLPYTGNQIELIKLDSSVTPADGNCYIKVEVNKVTVPADAYEVEYVSNVNKGKATVVIKPADTSEQDDAATAYTGGKVATFTIAPRKLADKDWLSTVVEAMGF